MRYSENYFTDAFNYYFRPSSVFLEPSHLTQFTVPIIIFELFRNDERKSLRKGMLFSLLCLLSTSGTAVVIVSIIWIGYVLYNSTESIKSFMKTVLIVIGIIVVVFLLYSNVSQIKFAIDRLSDTDSVVYTGRFSNGDYLTSRMSQLEKIIGVGFGNVDMTVYMNSVRYIFYTGGYSVIIIWLLLWLRLFFKENIIGKMVLICFLALCFSSRIFLSMGVFYYLLFSVLSNNITVYTEQSSDGVS